jgi:hypothetical protein
MGYVMCEAGLRLARVSIINTITTEISNEKLSIFVCIQEFFSHNNFSQREFNRRCD